MVCSVVAGWVGSAKTMMSPCMSLQIIISVLERSESAGHTHI